MRHTTRRPTLLAGLLVPTLVLAGCSHEGDAGKSPEQAARDAVGVQKGAKERATEAERNVVVEETTKVIDRDTGQVLKTEQTKTPVTIKQERTTERDVDVNAGETQKTVK